MTRQVDVENVLPILSLGWARFDFRHVDVELIERLQRFHQRTRTVVDGEKQRSPVVAGGWARFFADDEEAGGIGRAVLDGLFEQG